MAQTLAPLDLNKQYEDLSLVVEPLVDSMSELVLCGVTGTFEKVEQVCMNIAERAQKLVVIIFLQIYFFHKFHQVIATQVAQTSPDEQLQMEVANSLGEVALSIESLVISFNSLLISSNPTTQEGFAAAAKRVGEAINKLVVATDQTSASKVMHAVRDCLDSAKEVGSELLPTYVIDFRFEIPHSKEKICYCEVLKSKLTEL
jgi:hypothetical protein